MSAEVEALAEVPLFASLSSDALVAVAARARRERMAAGEVLIREGDPGSEFYVVLAGALEVSVGGRPVRRLGAGDFLGELALLFGAPRSATAVTLEPTTLLVMEHAGFTELLAADPVIEATVMAAVAGRLRYR